MKQPFAIAIAALGLTAFAGSSVAAIVEGRTQQDRRYIAGGIGLDEADQMRQQARQFPLRITVAAPSGAFLADTEIRITDQRGNAVLQTTIDAPMLLVDVPAGSYRVEATVRGHTQQRRVQIGSGHQNVVMTFNVPADTPASAISDRNVPGSGVIGQQQTERDQPSNRMQDRQRYPSR